MNRNTDVNLRSLLLATLLLLCWAAVDCAAQRSGVLVFDNPAVDFGTVALDSVTCHTRTIFLRNLSSLGPIDSLEFGFDDSSLISSGLLDISVSPTQLSRLDSGEDSATVTITWCPKTVDCIDTPKTLLTVVGVLRDTGGSTPVAAELVIRGCAVDSTGSQIDSLLVTRSRLAFTGYLPSECATDTLSLSLLGTAPRDVRLEVFGQDSALFAVTTGALIQRLAPQTPATVQVRYCPNDTVPRQASLRVIAEGVGAVLPDTVIVDLGGTGVTPLAFPTLIDMGMVDTGRCFDTTIRISNLSNQLLILRRVNYDTTINGSNFTIRLEGRHIDTFPSFIDLTIQFCPHSADSFSVDLTFQDSVGGVEFGWLRLVGVGKVPADTVTPRSISLRLDTADVRVGDPIRLVLHAQPPLAPSDINRVLYFTLTFPMRSLFFKGVDSTTASPGWTAQSQPTSDTTFLIALRPANSQSAPTSTPLALLFTGLTTGLPINEVALRLDSLGSILSPIAVSNGLVLLDGCELGTDPRMSRRVAIQGLRFHNGSGTTLEVDYRAPLHARAYLRVADASGTSVQTVELPEGTDADASATVLLQRIAPGLCVVELRAGESRATTLMMIGP